ncbi:MAG: hypothetical protein VX151_05685 [Candidatus Thermoplasmatota archaeon]|nr:hypothetical protein [Candidatus Thermoplasmatota archaeon]
MWLFVSGGFLSVVAHRTQPENLLVRARHPEHIRVFFSEAEQIHMPGADYPYRTVVSRDAVQSAMVNQIQTMAYDNFKASIDDLEYHDACLDIWRTMWAYGYRLRQEEV